MSRYCGKSTIAMFDLVGTFFVDEFYNNLYEHAVEQARRGQSSTVTDAYCLNVRNFLIGASKSEVSFKKLVTRLHKLYCNETVSNSGFGKFQDTFLSHFIPKEYFGSFSELQKDKIFKDIIIKTIGDFNRLVSKPSILNKIIDDHGNAMHIKYLQEQAVEIFIDQKEEILEKLAAEVRNDCGLVDNRGSKLKDQLLTETAARKLAESEKLKLLTALHKSVSDTSELRSEYEKTKWLLSEAETAKSELTKNYSDMNNNVSRLEDTNRSLNHSVMQLRTELTDRDTQISQWRQKCSAFAEQNAILQKRIDNMQAMQTMQSIQPQQVQTTPIVTSTKPKQNMPVIPAVAESDSESDNSGDDFIEVAQKPQVIPIANAQQPVFDRNQYRQTQSDFVFDDIGFG